MTLEIPSYISREENIEQKQMALMERRHEVAMIGLILQRDLQGKSNPDEVRAAVEERMLHLGDEAREFILSVLGDYLAAMQHALDLQKQVENFLTEKGIPCSKEKVGRFLFEEKTKRLPSAGRKILAYIKDGCFVMAFEEEEDYADFLGHDPAYTGLVKGTSGKFDQEVSFDISFGSQSRRRNFRVPMILVKGLPDNRQNYDLIVTHEWQHFMNRILLDLFRTVGPGWKTSKRVENSLLSDKNVGEIRKRNVPRHIKDEIFAGLRHGSGIERLGQELLGEGYKVLFDPLPLEDIPAMKSLIQEIVFEMKSLPAWIHTPSGRILLINHLTDVPLRRFPEWLRVLKKFFSRKKITEQSFTESLS